MKKYVFLVILTVNCLGCNSQSVNNYSFFKLFVTNEKDEVMLVEWHNAWEIPGQKYAWPSTVTQFVKAMANKHGITVDNIKLNTLATFHYDNRPNPTLMHYYTANYKQGELKVPLGCSAIKWVPIEEAFMLIPYDEMVQIMQQITAGPDKLWGAAYDIQRKTESAPRSSKVKESFYILNE